MVLTLLACLSGGVGSSILPTTMSARLNDAVDHLQPSHVLVVAHKISVLFSRWLTIVRRAMLMIVMGGVSLGAVGSDSDIGFTFLGSSTANSTLHQDA